jgi:predicted N-formylglutamate amidohydrolase
VTRPAPALLEPDEPPPFEVVNAHGRAVAVLVCDHAANRVPRRLGGLGLDAAALADHIAWDPGAAEVARGLAARLDAPLVLGGYSRLVVDLNRPLAHPGSIAQESAGMAVPGNRGLSPGEREARLAALFRPYHAAIDRLLDGRAGRPAVLLAIHSFTPVLAGVSRPWQVGVSHRSDPRLAVLLRDALAREEGLTVGDNEPYPIEDWIDYTVPVHGEGRGLPAAMIELRQDGVATPADAAKWADRLAAAWRWIEAEAVALCGSAPGTGAAPNRP